MRLRVFDLGTRWFWLVIFYKPHAYGESWLSAEVFAPSSIMRWFHFWQWEGIPKRQGFEEKLK